MLKSFYEAVLPRNGGHYCLFLLGSKSHVWADSIDELVEITEARSEQQGIYYAVESFKEPTTRSQTNALALRALRLDIDAGEKKHAKDPDGTYPTQRDALTAAVAFFQATRLAPSYIVSSGEGLHIYYCLSADLTPETWLPLAARLGELGDEHGLRIDTTCTTDTARILRPVGMLHPNGSRVSVLKATGVVYDAVELSNLLGAKPPARKFDMSVNADVALKVEGPPKSALKIAEHCAALRGVAEEAGDVPEPLWRAMLGVVKFTVEGLDIAHEWSHGHPEYDPAGTERKFNAWNAGPTSCAEFSRQTKACQGCAYNGKIKSPVQLGYLTEKQVEELPPEKQPEPPKEPERTGDPWDGCIPKGFSVQRIDGKLTLLGQVLVEKETETGDAIKVAVTVPITHNIFWLGYEAEALHSDDTAQVTLHKVDEHGRQLTYMLDQAIVASSHKLLEFLAGKRIHLTRNKRAVSAMSDYLIAQLQRIAGQLPREKIDGRFGLRVSGDGDLICVQGEHIIYGDGRIGTAMLGNALIGEPSRQFRIPLPPSGSGEWPAAVWDTDIMPKARRHAEFLRKHYGDHSLRKYQLACMLGLASPLMAFVTGEYHHGETLPPNGLAVSLYSREGGRGKTTLIKSIMLAFGPPGALVKDSNDLGSTDLARIGKMSMFGTFPVSMEEMGSTREASIARLISSIANGAGRERMNQKGARITSPQWALIALLTTNRAQRDMVAATQSESSAIQYRLLELNVDSIMFDQPSRDSFAADWADIQRDCAGALGAVIHRRICELGADKVNTAVVQCVSRADKLLGSKQEARFQYRALGAVLFLHQLLARDGLELFDLKDLVAEFRHAHDAGVDYVAENILPTNGVDLLAMVLSDLKPHTLITENETHRGYDRQKFDLPLNNRVPDKVLARHVTSMGHTYIASNALREWAVEHKLSERDMLSDCKRAGVLVPPKPEFPNNFTAQLDLFKGTREANATRTSCIKVNTRRLAALTGAEEEAPEADNVVPMRKQESGSAAAATPLENAS